MYLISESEVNTIAFVTPLETGTIKEDAIKTVDDSILNMVGQSIYDGMISKAPADTQLLYNYVKPYMAFAIKIITLNTIMSDGGLTPDEINSYKQAIKSADFNKKQYYSLLTNYLASNYDIPRKSISGFIIT